MIWAMILAILLMIGLITSNVLLLKKISRLKPPSTRPPVNDKKDEAADKHKATH